MNVHVLCAVFRRNFVSYFTNPTGYLFICLYVVASAFAAVWPDAFFNDNLANLNQLSKYFPLIMLFFIPTITMGVWAEERRQATDELLLTIPASDFDVVLGKYLAALAIYTVSLVFSLACILLVLEGLGSADVGLFLATYVGYWLVGAAMLAIGMVASFLTSNLTVAFILGVLFNAPLVRTEWTAVTLVPAWMAAGLRGIFAAVRLPTETLGRWNESLKEAAVVWAQNLDAWCIPEQFRDFGRGVISLSATAYFLLIAAIMLAICMILIGRRHWRADLGRWALALAYTTCMVALAVAALGLGILLQRFDARVDTTSEQLSSLSPQTVKLLSELSPERPVQIEAFISPTVPESYVQTRLNLLNMLRELKARGGANVRLNITNTGRFSEEAAIAEKRFGITPRQVDVSTHGRFAREQLFMGVAMTCGLQKIVIPFVDRGIPIEYELVRSICTVSQQKRKKVGVLQTDAQMYGRFNFQTMSSAGNWAIIDELEKQYELKQVDPKEPIAEKFDVLLAVQPSSLGPEEMDNFVRCIEGGQPTAIFEDPMPVFAAGVPGTSAPREAPGGMNMMMMGRQQAPPKGDVNRLWTLLGVDFSADLVIWQDYNPYKKATMFPREFVFIKNEEAGKLGSDEASAGLQLLLFPFPGSVKKLHASTLEFTPLVKTGERTGTVRQRDMWQFSPFGRRINEYRRQVPTSEVYTMAARIQGTIKPPQMMADGDLPEVPLPAGADKTGADRTAADRKEQPPRPKEAKINVTLVADVDMLTQDFFRLREQGEVPEAGIHFDFDNVTFVLNILDELSGDERFIALRKRRPTHRTLTAIEERTKGAREQAAKEREDYYKECEEAEEKAQKEFDAKIEDIQKRKDIAPEQLLIEMAVARRDGQQRLDATRDRARQRRDAKVDKIDRDLNLQFERVKAWYKFWAVALPPILPLALAGVVFIIRRVQETQGVARSRLR